MNYEAAMKSVLALAMKGAGKVSPNPKVGAVIIRDGEIVAEGWHKKFGSPHAEVEAINNSGLSDFSDCTLVVNLEPCSHFGKTPPCADLIIEKKFKKVVIGSFDPNPLVAGKGTEKIRTAGIEVIENVLEEDCKWMNRFFFKNIQTSMPYVIVKIGQSLNGAIATAKKESKWITGTESRKRVHALRALVDSVLIGKDTALKDDPELTVRSVKGVSPKRIVLDTNLKLPLQLKLFSDRNRKKTIILCADKFAKSFRANALAVAGINVQPVEINDSGRIDIKSALKILNDNFQISSVLVEGGTAVFSEFAALDLIDEIQLFQAPMIIGNGLNTFNYLKTDMLSDSKKFSVKAVNICGEDIHSILVRKT